MVASNVKKVVLDTAPRIDGSLEADAESLPLTGDLSGARALHQTLTEALVPATPGTAPGPAITPPLPEAPAPDAKTDGKADSKTGSKKPPFWSLNVSRNIKILVALALVAFFGARPLQSLLQAASVEAVVNSRVVTIRSPIEGEIVAAPVDFTAWSVTKGAPVLRISNPNADRARFDELRRATGKLDDERAGVAQRLERARATLANLEQQTAQFTAGRIQQLEARVAALKSEQAAAVARAEEAKAAHERLVALIARGATTPAELARANRDRIITSETERATVQRIEEATVELTSARNGSFLGDSYNDRPSSAQRADEVRSRIDDLIADLASRDLQRTRYGAELARETERYNLQVEAEVLLPATGRMWEIMVSTGERVRRDQDLLRILDCSSAVVTANVEEAVYNQLRIGAPARFRPADGGNDVIGTIVNLTGISGASGNLAIQPHGLQKQAYHVTMTVPSIAHSGTCHVGRTGRVYFDNAGAQAAEATDPLGFGLRR